MKDTELYDMSLVMLEVLALIKNKILFSPIMPSMKQKAKNLRFDVQRRASAIMNPKECDSCMVQEHVYLDVAGLGNNRGE